MTPSANKGHGRIKICSKISAPGFIHHSAICHRFRCAVDEKKPLRQLNLIQLNTLPETKQYRAGSAFIPEINQHHRHKLCKFISDT